MQTVNIDIGFTPTNNFIYGNKMYPFNLNVFKEKTQSLMTIRQNDNVEILTESEKDFVILTEDSIINFILCCHNKNYNINQRNAVPLNYLALKYNCKQIVNESKNFFEDNHDLKIELLELHNLMLQNKIGDISSKMVQLSNTVITQQDRITQLQNQIEYGSPMMNISYSSSKKGLLSKPSPINVLINITHGGYNNNNINNILQYDTNHFHNYASYTSNTSDDACWILFDFGFLKIELQSYLIRTNAYGPNTYFHPKTWSIYGSNDKENWTLLDERINDESLNGALYEKNFICSNSTNRSTNKRYRYIAYHQKECWSNINESYYNKYNIYITYFELFGKVFCT